MLNKLYNRIVLARKNAGILQKNLAELLGVTPQSLGKYEKGTRIPDADILNKIATVTGCDPGWLLTGEEPGTSTSGALDVPPEHRGYTDKLVKILASGNTSAITNVESIIDTYLKEIDPPGKKEGPGAASRAFTPDDEIVNEK